MPQEEIKTFETVSSRRKEGTQRIPGLAAKPSASTPVISAGSVSKASAPSAKLDKSKPELNALDTTPRNPSKDDINSSGSVVVSQSTEVSVDPARRLKALKKKLREISELELKINAGSLVISAEQNDKISKKASIITEIAVLENELVHISELPGVTAAPLSVFSAALSSVSELTKGDTPSHLKESTVHTHGVCNSTPDLKTQFRNAKKKMKSIEELERKLSMRPDYAPSAEEIEKISRKKTLDESIRSMEAELSSMGLL